VAAYGTLFRGRLMKHRSCWKRGSVLLQTVVMSVLLSLLCVMVIKLMMARYVLANRIQQSARNTGIAVGFATLNTPGWGTVVPTAFNYTPTNATLAPTPPDNKNITFIQSSANTFTTTVTDTY